MNGTNYYGQTNRISDFIENLYVAYICIIIIILGNLAMFASVLFHFANFMVKIIKYVNQVRDNKNINRKSFLSENIITSENVTKCLLEIHKMIPKKINKIKKYNIYETMECPICYCGLDSSACCLPCRHFYCPMCVYVLGIIYRKMQKCFICQRELIIKDCLIMK